MPTHTLTKRFPVGSTHRITVTTVRETPCEFNADTPADMFRYWQEVIATQPDYELDKESVVVVMLTTRMRPFAWHRVSLGTVCESSAHPREIFRPVIAAGAYAFALMHNHPSGDPLPSKSDDHITRRINEAAALMQIHFIDHVVIGEPLPGRSPYYSFREAGVVH